VDFINKFGDLGGFDKILARFTSSETKLTISVVVALLKPWGLCYDYLTQSTIKKYFAPIIVRIVLFEIKSFLCIKYFCRNSFHNFLIN
jgi:ubiquitin carboxyl-terminal hydrolase 9/24